MRWPASVTQTLVQSGYTTETREWKQEALTSSVPVNHVGGRINIRWSLTGGCAWIDDMMLYEEPG